LQYSPACGQRRRPSFANVARGRVIVSGNQHRDLVRFSDVPEMAARWHDAPVGCPKLLRPDPSDITLAGFVAEGPWCGDERRDSDELGNEPGSGRDI